jgi:type VI secretion system protein ImpA
MERINLKQLLSPCSEKNPSGDDLEYDPLFGEMERAAKGKEEQQFGDTLIPAEEPNWGNLKAQALAVLERSKDLRAAIQLTRAMIHTDGYAGLADGLSLIRGYLDKFWEDLHPRLDPDDGYDPTFRVNTLLNLCDPMEFLLPISRLPLVWSSRMGQFSYRDIQIANGATTQPESDAKQVSLEQVDAAFREIEPTQAQTTLSQLRLSLETLTAIEQRVSEKLGAVKSFDLQPLGALLGAMEKELGGRSWAGDLPQAGDGTESAGETTTLDVASPQGSINNRDDVIRTLDRICHYYARHEPSSPIPLLLQRAKRLVTMGFHEIVQDLAPEGQSHFDFLWRQGDG